MAKNRNKYTKPNYTANTESAKIENNNTTAEKDSIDKTVLEENVEPKKEATSPKVLKIKRKCKAGAVNVNGVHYTIDSYRSVLENTIIPAMKKRELSCEIFFGNYNPYEKITSERFFTINLSNSSCNKLISVEDEFICVEFTDDKIYNKLKDMIEHGLIVETTMRYTGDFIANEVTGTKLYSVNKIIGFDIMVPGEYQYHNYTEFKEYGE